ncbi:PIF-3 [Aratus pisonii nudivirus]|nr:PIF-3 [Aratus pisonii nudivirus]
MNDQKYSYSLKQPPTYYVYFIICVVVIFLFLIIIGLMFNKTSKRLSFDKINIKVGNLYGVGRKDCELTKTYCFTDNDCVQQCTASSFTCAHGICMNNVNTINATNDCDPSKGVIGYLVGNTALGTYEYICKSVDPAIAVSVTENRMCFGDKTYQINYLQSYPSIYTCECDDKVIIPATSQKREHVECNKIFVDLVPQ